MLLAGWCFIRASEAWICKADVYGTSVAERPLKLLFKDRMTRGRYSCRQHSILLEYSAL
jgi:hypothetical protein